MLQGLWSTLQNMFKCSVISTCSEAFNYFVRETEDCNPKFQLEVEYGERLGSVTSVQHFITKY